MGGGGRGGHTTSSNESLASNKLYGYRPRSNTNQSLGSANKAPGVHTPSADEDAAGVPADESATAAAAANVVKVGAFVSRPLSAAERLSMAEDDEDDPLLQLCSVDTTPSKPAPSAAQEAAPQHSETDSSDPMATKMDNLRLDESADKRREEDKFVVLDLKTPFSVRGQQLPPPGSGTSGTTSADLGIFFKGGSAPTAAATSSQAGAASGNLAGSTGSGGVSNLNLASQLENLGQQLEHFEKDLEEFDEMWKTMEIAPTSESESESVNY